MQSTIFVFYNTHFFCRGSLIIGFLNVQTSASRCCLPSPGDAERWLLHMSQFDEFGEPNGSPTDVESMMVGVMFYGEVGIRWALENPVTFKGAAITSGKLPLIFGHWEGIYSYITPFSNDRRGRPTFFVVELSYIHAKIVWLSVGLKLRNFWRQGGHVWPVQKVTMNSSLAGWRVEIYCKELEHCANICHITWSLPSGFLSMKCNYSFSLIFRWSQAIHLPCKRGFMTAFSMVNFHQQKLPLFVQHDPKEFVISWSCFRCKFFGAKTQLMMLQLGNVACLGPMDARTVWREFGGFGSETCWISFCLNLIP